MAAARHAPAPHVVAALRAHRSTDAAIDAAGGVWDRGALVVYGHIHRQARRRDWTRLVKAVAALPGIDPPTRTVAIVHLATDGSRRVRLGDRPRHRARLLHARLGDHARTRLARPPRRGDRRHDRRRGRAARRAPAAATARRDAARRPGPRPRRRRSAVANDAPVLRADDAGAVATPLGTAEPVTGATAACLLVDRRAYDAAGGLCRTRRRSRPRDVRACAGACKHAAAPSSWSRRRRRRPPSGALAGRARASGRGARRRVARVRRRRTARR